MYFLQKRKSLQKFNFIRSIQIQLQSYKQVTTSFKFLNFKKSFQYVGNTI